MTDAHIEPLDVNEAVSEQIGDALREAQNATLIDLKLEALRRAEELLLTKDHSGHHLDNFLDEMMEFSQSMDVALKCFVATFIEKACKKDPEVMKKAILILSSLLLTGLTKVQKQVIRVSSNLYPVVLKWAVGRRMDQDAEKCWEAYCVLKGRIIQLIDVDNEGIRTMTLKFLESVVLAQSMKTDECESGRGDLMSLGEVSRDHRYISYRKMQTEATYYFQTLIEQTTVSHISAQNLLTALSSICLIARQRTEFMGKSVDALEVLHVNLPPTLGTSQVKSVRKELKMHMLRILRHPSSFPLHNRIITLLTDLGATTNEMNRYLPANIADLRKKNKRAGEGDEPMAKKSKTDDDEASRPLEDDEYAEESTSQQGQRGSSTAQGAAIDITSQFIFERLTPQVVAHLVIISLVTLPDEMPAAFASSYTPIAGAGQEAQVQHLSRMIATQATQQGLGPGFEQLQKERLQQRQNRESARMEGVLIPPTPAHFMRTDEPSTSQRKTIKVQPGLPGPKQKQQFNIITATQELSKEALLELFELCFRRIMNAERRAVQGGAGAVHNVVLVRLVTRFDTDNPLFETLLIDFIVEEHKQRTDLALLWVTELYSQYHGFSHCIKTTTTEEIRANRSKTESFNRYDKIVCALLNSLFQNGHHKEALFHKILLEAPLVTTNALGWLKVACLDLTYGAFGMTTLRELLLTRNRQRDELLDLLFSFCFCERPEQVQGANSTKEQLHKSCIETVKELCELPYLRGDVRNKLIQHIGLCRGGDPPEQLLKLIDMNLPPEERDESLFRAALQLYLAILPIDPSLLLPLAEVYAVASSTFKRVVLRSVETAVRAIGMQNEEMLRLVEECPVGAESLVSRVVYLLTERNPVTKELVDRLVILHEARNADVRGLIPVLNGLDKEYIISILPQFLLNQTNLRSVNQVFRRLLTGRNIETGEPVINSIDLILELHKIQPKNEAEATMLADGLSELLSSRAVSKESVASAVEALMDMRPLPLLFYSTLRIVYKKYASLDGFLTNVVQKIINKKLWTVDAESKTAFFEALKHLKTVCYTPVLTSFTIEELQELMNNSTNPGDIKLALKEHFTLLSTHQQKNISAPVLDLIEVEREKERERADREERDQERRRDRGERERRDRKRDRGDRDKGESSSRRVAAN